MDAKAWIKEDFLRPFYEEGRKNIGVELEFPLLNIGGELPQKEVALGLFNALLAEKSFSVAETDQNGRPAFLVNQDGDVLSFDNSYHNFEFSLEKNENLCCLSARFSHLFSRVQAYFLPLGYTLCGTGTNPFGKTLAPLFVPFPVYNMVRQFLEQYSGGLYHQYPAFPATLSSVQTHLDVQIAELPRALTLFASLDFVRALLFSNSPAFLGEDAFSDCVCFRDYLWEKSGFSSLAANVGKVEGEYKSLDDVAGGILARSMFYRVRSGEYELFPPATLREYFESGAPKTDLAYYLSFRNIEITRRGTLEVRSDCAQPVCDSFCPPAFHLGILSALNEAEERLSLFFREHLSKELVSSPNRNAILRDAFIYHQTLPAAPDATRQLLCDLVSLAERALKKREKGEECLLAPLFARAETLTCPAMRWTAQLTAGVPICELITQFAK